MRTTRWTVLAALCLALSTSTAWPGDDDEDAPAWKHFTSKKCHFSVDFPGNPKQEVKQAGNEGARIEITLFTAANPADKLTYIISYFRLPAKPNAEQTKQVMDSFRDSMIASAKAEITKQKKIKLGGEYPGYDVEFEMKKGVGRARIYVVGSRMYSVMVAGTGDLHGKNVNRYFRSFDVDDE